MEIIDLRSDTVTLPTDAMIEAARAAALGDDSLDGDPTVRRLEELAADATGKDDALFVVSGTMGNVIAALVYASDGGEAIMDEGAHMARSEVGGLSRLAGLTCRPIPASGGEMDLDILSDSLRSDFGKHGPPTAMVVVETSHNHAGGAVPSRAYMKTVRDLTQKADVAVHMDGARLFNAAAALGLAARDIAGYADSVAFCLSKGLSAPMGSMLAGSASFIRRARTYRRMVGGGLRQAGSVAAAGIVALETMADRLADDHRHAVQLWRILHDKSPELVSDTPPQTNMLHLRVTHANKSLPANAWVGTLERHGVRTRMRDTHTLRLVTHRHIGPEQIQSAAAVILANMTGNPDGNGLFLIKED